MARRSIYIWKLSQVINAEGSVQKVVDKARRARLSALWVKIADGPSAYQNVTGQMAGKFQDLVDRCHNIGIEVWGWHVPRCPTANAAAIEAANVGNIAAGFGLDGLIMDAEHGANFFLGGVPEADAYGRAMRIAASQIGKPLALSSHDIPRNMEGWLPKFNKIAAHSDLNYPQAYYGGSPSVVHRLDRAEDANAHLTIPFCPVGAGWLGDGGGCSSASACAERAREFIRLVKERGHHEYSFWHWTGAPSTLWAVLNTVPA
jgi:hypothetical protein